MDKLVTSVTLKIYPTCCFVPQMHHIDSAMWYVLDQLGFFTATQGQEQTKCCAAVQKAIFNTITDLQNCTLEHYRDMALGKIVHEDLAYCMLYCCSLLFLLFYVQIPLIPDWFYLNSMIYYLMNGPSCSWVKILPFLVQNRSIEKYQSSWVGYL